MVHHEVCPLCSSEKIKSHFRCTDHLVSKEVFEVFKCADCSFEFTQDYPEETEIGKYYESDNYISHNDSAKGFSNKIYRLVRNLMLKKKKRIIISHTGLQKGRILDIGCGTGYFASEMKKAGWLVKGVEINKKARDFAISRFGLEVISPGQIDTLEADSFDCIALWHVLEHFHDPFKYSSDILRLLKPGGLCLVALPNSNSYDSGYFKEFWAAFDVPRHLWHFNPSSFRLFSKKSGFMLKNIRTLPLDVFYISILSQKNRGSKIPFFTGVLQALPFAFLSAFNRRMCSSIIYLLRKPSDQ